VTDISNLKARLRERLLDTSTSAKAAEGDVWLRERLLDPKGRKAEVKEKYLSASETPEIQ
jgi:hypothetical protein